MELIEMIQFPEMKNSEIQCIQVHIILYEQKY